MKSLPDAANETGEGIKVATTAVRSKKRKACFIGFLGVIAFIWSILGLRFQVLKDSVLETHEALKESSESWTFNDGIGVGNNGSKNEHAPKSSDEQNETNKKAEKFHPFNMCLKSSFPIHVPERDKTTDFVIEYRCNGTEYESFGDMLQQFLHYNATLLPHSTPHWGRHQDVLPRGKSVLCLGNSHTKQTIHELICQFSHRVVALHRYEHKKMYAVEFANNSTLFLAYNSPVEASRNWTGKLEHLIHRPLASFDAVVLGQFNSASKDIQNTSFYKQMMNLSMHDADVEFGKVEPPDIVGVANEFSGPIVFTSNYDLGKLKRARKIAEAMEELRKNEGRENMRHVIGRDYIPYFDGHECGSDDRTGVGTCGATRGASHRCVGPKGGYPTLVAFDVQDYLFSLLQ